MARKYDASITTNRTSAGAIRALLITGTTYGNDAAYLESTTNGDFSLGDPGPQIQFGTSAGTAKAAIIYTNHDSNGLAGSSFQFVSDENPINLVAGGIVGKTRAVFGQRNLNTSYTLYTRGIANFNIAADNAYGINGHRLNAIFEGTNHASILIATPTNNHAYGIAVNQNGYMYIGYRNNGSYTSYTGDVYSLILNKNISFYPSSSNTTDLGTTSNLWKTAYIQGGVYIKYTAGEDHNLIALSGAPNYGIRYKEGTPDTLKLSASNNANSDNADFCINAHGEGTLANRGKRIPHTGNNTGTVGTATRPVYVNAGTITQGSYELKATVEDGTATHLAYYSAARTIDYASNIQYIPTQNAELGTTKGSVNGLFIYGPAYGNDTANLGSATINVFRYGDPGPQIRFSTGLGTANAGAAESSAIIWSDHSSSIGTDQSFHFVGQNNTSHAASNVGVVTNTFIGKTRISAGVNYANTNYVLFSNGTTGINGQLYLQGVSTRDTAPSSNDNRVLFFTDSARNDQGHIYFRHDTAGKHLMYLNTYSSGTKATRDHIVLISDTDTTDPHYIQINSRISTGLNISDTRGFAYNAAIAGTHISAAGNIHITAASPYLQFYNNTSASYTGYIQDTAANGMIFVHGTAATTAVTALAPINGNFKPQFELRGLTYINGNLMANGSTYIKGRVTSYDQWNIIYLSNITKTIAPSSATDGGIILRDKAGTNVALFRIWENTSMDRCANMYVYGNSNNAEVSIFATASGDRYLQWTGGIVNHTVEARGLLKSTSHSNTVTIGSQNADFTHIYNSANIPFIFNKSVVVYDGNLGNESYPWNNIYLGNRTGTANADIILHSSKANNTLIRFLVNTSNSDGQGIRIGGGGLTIIGGGESAATVQSGTGYASDAEQMLVTNDSSIKFYPNQQSGYTASALIEMTAGRLWAGVNGDTTRENQIGVQSGAGQLYMYSAASTTGAKGIYFSAHGDSPAGYIAHVDSAHRVYYNSNFTSQRIKLIANQGSQINSGVWLRTCIVQSYQNYANFQIRLTGGWSTGSPTVATIDVNMRNGQASMKLVHRGFLGVIGKVKLVKLETNTAYLDVYVRENSNNTDYFGQFIGNVTVTQNNNTTHGTTNVTTTDVDGLATLDLTAGVGNASTPVYIGADGKPTACTAYSSATNIRAATVNINNDTTSKLFVLGATTTGYTSIYRESSVYMQNNVLYGAAWNDYAEFRQLKENKKIEPGRVVYENGDDTLSMSNERLMRGCSIVSDTYGFGIGESEEAQLPIAVSGRVLAYPYEDKEEFKNHIGWPVCSGPNGTVSIMTEEEEMKYPSRIIGTISAIPDYEIWHGGADVVVDGRVWIKVR